MSKKWTLSTSIGLLLGFLGMAGIVLSIISLIPLNGYNIYMSTTTLIKLARIEYGRTHDWWYAFSYDAKLYLIFLFGSALSSIFEILLSFMACCAHQSKSNKMVDEHSISNNNSNNNGRYIKQLSSNQTTHTQISNGNTWFIRFACFILTVQIAFALLGTHIIYILKSNVISVDIQNAASISLYILWINYISLTIFAFILFCASFFILIGAQKQRIIQDEESRPLIL
ncbi:hypothetical protein BDB01DRAFT_850896 [Pilobolus umbonatus]|nr:hypothetical protein BDB01DRAFT_850896 [Pilobolus umbonatus]